MNYSLSQLKNIIDNKPAEDSLKILSEIFSGKIVFSSSLGLEDQVITHLIFSNDLPVEIFTIDTGRLFNEIYSVLNKTNEQYGKKIRIFFPENSKVEKLVNEKGPFSFYESVENRKECCFIRKVEPLKRALEGKQLWITGIRAEQSESRKEMENLEWDDQYKIYKYHPLFDWTFEDIKNFITKNNVPYNILHDKGFISIGCTPCTRAVSAGEDFRAGRWWWENGSEKECGLHVHEVK
ncbi:MAG TPA: phosphoadenylyl-sulfate reductase [Ignavibacteriaceae bacterium]|nr:phosphoadenylyl-sulfate reductase [Ignavibacteriaceae bacterium]